MTNDIDLNLLSKILFHPNGAESLPEEDLYSLLRMGVLLTLQQNGSPAAIELLARTTVECSSINTQGLAFHLLSEMALKSNLDAIRAVYDLAVYQDYLPARQFILTQNITAPDPALQLIFFLLTNQTEKIQRTASGYNLLTAFFKNAPEAVRRRLLHAAQSGPLSNWALIVSSFFSAPEINTEQIIEKFPFFLPEECDLVIRLLFERCEQNNPSAQEIVCQLVILYDSPAARDLALNFHLVPTDAVQRSLFFFLSNQWPEYQALDFDHSLIADAYLHAAAPVRKRILEASKYAGETAWVQNLVGGYQSRWIGDMNDSDWSSVINRLKSERKWSDLWRLAQTASPLWSCKIVQTLTKVNWKPESTEEMEGFSTFSQFSTPCLSEPLKIRQRSALQSPSTPILSIAVSPREDKLAAAGQAPEIHLWDLAKTPSPLSPIHCSVPGAHVLKFSPDGNYLAVGNVDHSLRLYQFPDGKIVKTIPGHTNIIRSIVFQPDGRSFYSAGFDGNIIIRRFPYGSDMKTIQTGHGEIYSMGIDATGQMLVTAGADKKIRTWKAPEGTLVNQIEAHGGVITQLAVSSRGQLAASYSKEDQALRIWNFFSGKLVREILLEDPQCILTSIWLDPSELVIFAGSSTGSIYVWSLSSGKLYQELSQKQRQPVIGLQSAYEGKTLISGLSSGTIYFWDLEIFFMIRSPLDKLEKERDHIQSLLDNSSLSSSEKNWLNYGKQMIQWRQRYNIEIGEPVHIQAGEFDIEL